MSAIVCATKRLNDNILVAAIWCAGTMMREFNAPTFYFGGGDSAHH